ncbi:MAG: helix-turn-helix domain-containing protein [Alphaproteobacteria bacterium]
MTPVRASRLAPASEIARHRHAGGYATLVLSGAYEEAGDGGRFRVEAGDVLLHAPFSVHRDRIARSGTVLLDLVLPFDGRQWTPRARPRDPDTVIRTAARDGREAAALLIETLVPNNDGEADLPDLLAHDLSDAPNLSIASWAAGHGVARETAWRQFDRAYGAGPAAYRAEARARCAWRLVMATGRSLADIAAAAGFADQAHMTRAVKALTGRSPGRWRAATSVQDASAVAS